MAGQALDGWIRAALAGQRVQVAWPRLEWLYAKDAARGATLAWWGDGLAGRVFNVGMGCGVSAADIAAAIRAVVPDAPLTSAEVVDDGRGVLSGEKFAMNPDRARRDLGYELAFGLAAAISGYVAWLRARPS